MPNPSSPKYDVECDDLWAQWLERGDTTARAALFEHYVWLARSIAMRVIDGRAISFQELADCTQSASLALLQAIDRFKPTNGVHFVAYAKKRVSGELHDYINGSTEKQRQISYRRQYLSDRVQSVKQSMTNTSSDKKRTSSNKQAKSKGADNSGLFNEMVELAVGLAVGFLLEDTSLVEQPTAADDNAPYQSIELDNLREHMRHIVNLLPVNHRRVVQYHYYHDMNFVTIADSLNLTRSRISQIHAEAINKIKEAYHSVSQIDQLV